MKLYRNLNRRQALCLVAFLLAAGGARAEEPDAMRALSGETWEYKIVSERAETTLGVAKLNQLGQEGWELASAVTVSAAEMHYILKRKWIETEAGKRQARELSEFGPPRPLPEDIADNLIQTIPIDKDSMILSYIPQWAHGNVDNIAVANNGGGVRILLDWPEIDPALLSDDGVRILLAMYSRKTTLAEPAGTIGIHEITEPWDELTSWDTQPSASASPLSSASFEPGDGWKFFDVTDIVRRKAPESGAHGIMLHFEKEDRASGDWSGYAFVSREGHALWKGSRPALLVLKK